MNLTYKRHKLDLGSVPNMYKTFLLIVLKNLFFTYDETRLKAVKFYYA